MALNLLVNSKFLKTFVMKVHTELHCGVSIEHTKLQNNFFIYYQDIVDKVQQLFSNSVSRVGFNSRPSNFEKSILTSSAAEVCYFTSIRAGFSRYNIEFLIFLIFRQCNFIFHPIVLLVKSLDTDKHNEQKMILNF